MSIVQCACTVQTTHIIVIRTMAATIQINESHWPFSLTIFSVSSGLQRSFWLMDRLFEIWKHSTFVVTWDRYCKVSCTRRPGVPAVRMNIRRIPADNVTSTCAFCAVCTRQKWHLFLLGASPFFGIISLKIWRVLCGMVNNEWIYEFMETFGSSFTTA